MRKILSITALSILIQSCGDVPRKYVWIPAKPQADTCRTAWNVTADAWELYIGEVSARCERLDEKVSINVTDPEDMPCEGAVACTIGDAMFLSSELSWHQAPSVAVHEWLHVLARCEDGDSDKTHERIELWSSLHPEGVRSETPEGEAIRQAPHGPCLGVPDRDTFEP